ncbi:MAG TPA: ComEA family DNA-binding protein [Candidatus Limnocylindrales bacterium]|nr:ComEA family DNA-binding protein [Candidatus Limnocylindrales bacterium]
MAAPDDAAFPVAVKVIAGVGGAIACAGLAIAVALSGGGGEIRVDGGAPLPSAAASAGDSEPDGIGGATVGGELVVEIVGAVQAPGVYRLPSGSRVADLLERAGGYGPRVDAARAEQELNLAAPVKDGEHIRVPSRDDPSTHAAADSAAPAGSGSGGVGAPLDINTASQAQLEELPGIGPATAQKIIAAREEAPFSAVDELRSRKVLGEKTFEKLRPLVTVG